MYSIVSSSNDILSTLLLVGSIDARCINLSFIFSLRLLSEITRLLSRSSTSALQRLFLFPFAYSVFEFFSFCCSVSCFSPLF
uniref:Putative ovule protein n=1 Tax=Solanum chacoense TaxID=4108 RepID=A0A0V0HF39_SOLCH